MPRVNPDILIWARETAGLSIAQAAEKLGIGDARGVLAEDRLAAIELGTVEPTRPLILKMSQQYRRPLLTFYLEAPPRQGNRGRDFRTLPDGELRQTDAFLDALIRDVQARQSMVRAVLDAEDEAEPLPFIGSARIADGVESVRASIQSKLGITRRDYRAQRTVEQAFTYLRDAAERSGVFVILKGDLGNYRTAISVEIFRGFAIADEVAPFIIINDRDAKAAWPFTLLHELAHLWLGATGVSGGRVDLEIERFCNEIASGFLLDDDELSAIDTSASNIAQQISRFAGQRHISLTMAAYRLHRLGRIDEEDFAALSALFRAQWLAARQAQREADRDQEGGPSYYLVRRHRLGQGLLGFARRMMAGRALSPTKAARVLGVKPVNVQALLYGGPNGLGRVA